MQKVCPCVLVGLQFWYPHMQMNIGDLEKTEEGTGMIKSIEWRLCEGRLNRLGHLNLEKG